MCSGYPAGQVVERSGVHIAAKCQLCQGRNFVCDVCCVCALHCKNDYSLICHKRLTYFLYIMPWAYLTLECSHRGYNEYTDSTQSLGRSGRGEELINRPNVPRLSKLSR